MGGTTCLRWPRDHACAIPIPFPISSDPFRRKDEHSASADRYRSAAEPEGQLVESQTSGSKQPDSTPSTPSLSSFEEIAGL